jgi:TP901 family phage tail tape measure protein
MAAIVINVAGSYDDRALSAAQKRLEGLKGSGTGLAGKFAAVGASMQAFGGKVSGVGKTLTRSVTLPIVGLGVAAVKSFSDFDAAITESTAIMGNVTDDVRKRMEDAARSVATTLGISHKEAAESFYFLASAGMDAEQSIAALPAVAAFSKAGMFDMARATDLATDAQSALGMTSKDSQENLANLTRVTDVFVKANTLANASVEQFAEAMTAKAGTALRVVGKDIEEGTAVLSVFADQGIKGSAAGTLLTRTLEGLQDNARKNSKAFEEAGISVYDANGNMRNMADITVDLEKAMAGMSSEQKNALLSQLGFNKLAKSGVLALVGNSDALRTYEDGLRSAGGTVDEVAQKQLGSFSEQMNLLKSQLVDIGIDVAPTIIDGFVKPFADGLKSLVDRFKSLSPEQQGMITKFLMIAAAVGPVLLIVGKLITGLGMLVSGIGGVISIVGTVIGFMTKLALGSKIAAAGMWLLNAALGANPIFLIVAAIAALVAGLILAYHKFDWFRNLVDTVWQGIQAATKVVVDWFMATVWPTLQRVFQSIGAALGVLWNAYKAYWTLIFNAVRTVVGWFMTYVWPTLQRVFALVGSAVGVLWDAYKRYWTFIFDLVKKVVDWFMTTMWPTIRTAFDNAKKGAELLWQGIQVAFNLIRSHVQTVINTVLSILRGIGSVVATVIGFFTAIRQGIIDRFTAAVEFVRGIPGKILAALGNVASTLFSAGADLISGLISGIRSRAQAVLDTIKSFITDRIPQFVKDRLGISSPSRVMMDVGKWIPEGLAKGIRSRANAVTKATAALAAATTDSAKKAAKKALEEAEKAARDLARKINQAVRQGAERGLERMKGLAKQVLDYVAGVVSQIRDFGKLSGFDINAIDAARKALVEAQEDVTAAIKARTKAQERLNAAEAGDAADEKAEARDALAEASNKVIDAQKRLDSATRQVQDTTPSAANFIADMRKRLSAAASFASVVRSLSMMGLNNASLQEIIGLGPGAGTTFGMGIIQGGVDAVREINELEAALRGVGEAIGDVGARSQYGMGLSSARGIDATTVNVQNGAVQINFGAGIEARDRAALQRDVEQAVQDALRVLAQEIRAS